MVERERHEMREGDRSVAGNDVVDEILKLAHSPLSDPPAENEDWMALAVAVALPLAWEGRPSSGATACRADRILERPSRRPVALPAGHTNQHPRAVAADKAHLLALWRAARIAEQEVHRILRLPPAACAVVELLEILRRGWHLEPPTPAVEALEREG